MTLLSKIDEYFRENSIPFKYIEVNYTYFSKYINNAIEETLRNISFEGEAIAPNYILMYDDADNLCLVAGTNKKSKLVISDVDNSYDIKVPFPCTKYKLSDIEANACAEKYLEFDRLAIRDIISKHNYNMTSHDRVKLERDIFIKIKERVLKEKDVEDIKKECGYDLDINLTNDRVLKYVKYLNDEYIESLKLPVITYDNPDAAKRTQRGSKKGIILVSGERKNSVINVEEREKILKKYNPVYSLLAKSNEKDDADFLCYLYKYNEGYRLILEPYNGLKYARLINFSISEYIDEERFEKIARYYLELNSDEVTHSRNIKRLGHTSENVYKNVLNYCLSNDNKYKINPETKSSIDSITTYNIDDLLAKQL